MENEQFIKKEFGEIFDFSEKHKIVDGIYSDIYVRDNFQKELKEYKIDYVEIDRKLSNIAIKYEKVTTGYSTYRENCENTIGYKFNEIKIFISHNDKYIDHIWFDFDFNESNAAENLYEILEKITKDYDLIFVNWSWQFYSRIKQDLKLKNKLIEISKKLLKE
jgi:hypothetical protein